MSSPSSSMIYAVPSALLGPRGNGWTYRLHGDVKGLGVTHSKHPDLQRRNRPSLFGPSSVNAQADLHDKGRARPRSPAQRVNQRGVPGSEPRALLALETLLKLPLDTAGQRHQGLQVPWRQGKLGASIARAGETGTLTQQPAGKRAALVPQRATVLPPLFPPLVWTPAGRCTPAVPFPVMSRRQAHSCGQPGRCLAEMCVSGFTYAALAASRRTYCGLTASAKRSGSGSFGSALFWGRTESGNVPLSSLFSSSLFRLCAGERTKGTLCLTLWQKQNTEPWLSFLPRPASGKSCRVQRGSGEGA